MSSENSLNQIPKFYSNPAGGVYTKQMGLGNINSAFIPIIKRITGTYDFPFGSGIGVPIKIRHNLGKIHDCYVRFREHGTANWYSSPAIDYLNPSAGIPQTFKVTNITNDYIEINHFDVLGADLKTDVEIYFIEFPLNYS